MLRAHRHTPFHTHSREAALLRSFPPKMVRQSKSAAIPKSLTTIELPKTNKASCSAAAIWQFNLLSLFFLRLFVRYHLFPFPNLPSSSKRVNHHQGIIYFSLEPRRESFFPATAAAERKGEQTQFPAISSGGGKKNQIK